MMPVIPNSINNIPLIPGTPFTTRKNECLKRCNILRNSAKQTWFSQKDVLPLSTSVRLFPQFRSGFSLNHKSRIHITSATGADLAVEEADSPVANEDSGAGQEIPSDAVGTSDESSSVKSDASAAPAQSKRPRPTRKSDMPPVKPEELVPGAAFNGKVRSIQPFGAFVDFGAFTDGLVHVSRLSDSFVKDVGNIVSVGQEVKVRLVEANMETGRISLTMRESDDISKLQQRTDAPPSTDKSRPPRKGPPRTNQKRNEVKKASKFAKGQDLEGTVKNLTRSGAFISLPEGEEGFLPTSEELDEGFVNMMGGSSLQVGQEVSVRVLRITRGQVTLTMKKEEAAGELDSKLQGVVHTATNPFLLAFRKNKDIGAFLDEREKEVELAESSGIPHTSDEMGGKVSQTETELNEVQEQLTSSGVSEKVEGKVNESGTLLDEKEKEAEEAESSGIPKTSDEMGGEVGQTQTELTEVQGEQESSSEGLAGALSAVDKTVEDDEISSKQVDVEGGTVQDASNEIADDNRDPENIVSDLSDAIDGAIQSMEEKADASSEILAPEESISTSDQLTEKAPEIDSVQVSSEILSAEEGVFATGEVSTNDKKSDLSGKITDPIMSESEISKEVKESGAGETIAKDVEITTPNAANEILSATIAEDEKVGINPDKNGSVTSSNGQIDIPEVQQSINEENEIPSAALVEDDKVNEEGKNEIDNSKVKDELKKETPAADNEIPSAALVEDEKVNEEVKNGVDNSKAKDELKNETSAADNEIPSATPVGNEKVGSVPEKNGTAINSNGQNGTSSPKESTTNAAISPALVKQLREETGAGMMDCKKALSETGGDLEKAQEFLRKKGLASADKKASRATAEGRIGSYIHDSRIGILIEVNCETDFVSRGDIFKELVDDLAMQAAACPQVQHLVTEDVPKETVDKEREIEMQKEDLLSKPEQIRSKIVEGRIRKRLEELALLEQPYIKNDKMVVKDWVKQTIATIGENIKVKRFVRYNLGEGLEKKSQDFAAEVAAQTAAKQVASPGKEQPAVAEAKGTVDTPPKATISAALVKQLREETGAGMMDCKKALSETGGDLEKAQEYLRKKGLSAADKKSSRLAAEGRIGSYIHDARIGVLIEVNCETDFVGRSEKFKELVDDLAMQVVACPQVQFVSIEDIPESVRIKEKELEMQREDLLSKPENIRERIVEGRISKRLGELALLEQPFIKDDSILVKDLVKQTVAALGENIKVRRFVRFTLGEMNETAKTENEA